jgi:hypothetical protein
MVAGEAPETIVPPDQPDPNSALGLGGEHDAPSFVAVMARCWSPFTVSEWASENWRDGRSVMDGDTDGRAAECASTRAEGL